MKKALILIFLLVAAGIGASFFLIPRTPEIALINFKDKRFEEARAAYEQQLKDGKLTPEVVDNIVTLYLQENRLEESIAVMEQYIAAHPNDLAARRRLGQLYQYAQRPDDYLKNLEEISKLEPTAKVYGELSQIYNFKAEYDKQAEALKSLIAAENESNPQHFIDLANIQASRAARTDAIATLTRLYQAHPEAFTFREMELLVSLELDEGKVDDAYNHALAWRQKNPPTAEVARLVNLLHFKGGMAQAAQLLSTYEQAALEADTALLTEKVLLQLDSGQENDAYAMLKELHRQEKLEPALQNRLLFLAIARADNEVAGALLKTLDVKSLNESEAMALLELSVSKGDVSMQRQLANAYSAEEYKASYPLLTAMLSVVQRKADAKEQLAKLEKTELTPQQNLQVARLCLRVKDFACSETFLGRLPSPETLKNADVAAVGNLYLELKAYDKGYAFINRMAKDRQSPAIEEVRAKFASARGEDKVVKEWLAANPNASRRTMSDLYFAAHNNKHHNLALAVAEKLYASDKDADTRSYLANAYLTVGDYAKALPLLRESRNASRADESNYLFVLMKLAPRSAQYRTELGEYAASQLKAGLPYERKLSLIYALIEAGQVDVAMPYIRELALQNGGQWAWLYADQLTRAGRHEEARQFWVALANQSSTTREQKRAIAFNLLSGGYAGDAEPIFRQLAASGGAESDDVKRLLWLWGPRLSGQQLDWLAERYDAANGQEKAQWADYIARYSGPEDIVPFAEQRHPETLFAPPVLRAYVTALAANGQLHDKHAALMQGITEQNDPSLLRIYAETARAYDYKREAREAYTQLFSMAPEDNDALRTLGLLAFAQADYTASRSYFNEYLREDGLKRDTPENALAAAYTYAELLRHAGKNKDAAPYYDYVIKQADAYALTSSDALSKKAQAQIWLGQTGQGLATLEHATERYSGNDVLMADRISTLIELKRYKEARALLAGPLERLSAPQPLPEALALPADAMVNPRLSANGNEALIGLTGSEEDIAAFAAHAQNLPWVAYTSQGSSKLLISAKPGYRLNFTRDETGQPVLAAEPSPTDEAQRQIALRYSLLAARIDLETGNVYAANKRLNAIMPEYPGDAQLMGFAANAENYGGNPHRAQALLNVAKTLAPENEDIALLDRDIRRSYAPNVKIDHEWVKRGSDATENITTLSGQVSARRDVTLSVALQNDRVDADGVRRADGRVGNFKRNRQRGQVSAELHRDNGHRAKATLFANNDTLGAGLYYEFLNPLGESGVGLEYHRAYWEYVEGVLDDATRDRVSIWHTLKPSTRWAIRLEPGLNRYNVHDKDNVGRSWSLTGQVVYRPIESAPYLYLGYGLDAEYFLSKDTDVDAAGTVYQPLPLRSREIHFLSFNTGYEFSETTYANAMLGYGYDRLGGSGPLVEGRLTHEFTNRLDAQLRASYGLDTEDTNNEIIRVGGYLRYRF